MLRKLVLSGEAALGEGTRHAGEVLAYLPVGVDPRELETLMRNPQLWSVHNAPELEPATAGDDAAGEGDTSGEGNAGDDAGEATASDDGGEGDAPAADAAAEPDAAPEPDADTAGQPAKRRPGRPRGGKQ